MIDVKEVSPETFTKIVNTKIDTRKLDEVFAILNIKLEVRTK